MCLAGPVMRPAQLAAAVLVSVATPPPALLPAPTGEGWDGAATVLLRAAAGLVAAAERDAIAVAA